MAEYIDRSRLIDNLHDEEEMGVSDMWEAIDNAIDRTPVADVCEVVHAHWVKLGEADFRCSKCGFRFTPGDPIDAFPYCRCGALMDEEADKRDTAVNDEAAEANPEPEKKPPFNPGDLVRSPCPMGGTGKTFSVVECYEVEDAPAGVTLWHLDLRADDGRILTALPASLYMMVKPHRETFRERLKREYPGEDPFELSGIVRCPIFFGFEKERPANCDFIRCCDCWDREIPEGVTDDA